MSLRIFWLIAVMFAVVTAHAAAVVNGPPPVQAFFSYPQISDVQISPDGKYLAMVVADDDTGENRKLLAIIGAVDRKPKAGFRVADGNEIWNFWWANNERVLIATATRTGALSAATPDGALYAIDVDATQSLQLLGYKSDMSAEPAGVKDPTANFTHLRHSSSNENAHKDYIFNGMLFIPNANARHVLVD